MNPAMQDPDAAPALPAATQGEVAPWIVRAGQAGLGIAILAAWQLASGRLVDPFFISSPAEVGARLLRWAGDGTLLAHGSYTLRAMVAGFVLGAASGFATGFALGRNDLLARILDRWSASTSTRCGSWAAAGWPSSGMSCCPPPRPG